MSDFDVRCHARHGDADVSADLTDLAQVDAVLSTMAPDVIVNLAALTDVDACERDPPRAYQANVRIVENLAAGIKARGLSCHLVQLSTDQVYDGAGPHAEEHLAPSNYYGLSKYAGELVAASVPSTVLRTNFFGPSQCPGRVTLSDWIVESLTHERPITVFDDVQFSPLTLRRLVTLIELVIVNRSRGVFNVGSRDGMSKADFAFTLADVLGLPTTSMRRGRSDSRGLAAYRPKDMRMASLRFERAFGLELPTLRQEIQSLKASAS